MSEWKQKRFWTSVASAPVEGGYAVQLDGRGVKTPAKAALVVPTSALADAIAAEWDAQEGTVDPRTMPFTRSANAAIDKVRIQHGEVADMLADYGDADLLCYRATTPEELMARQAAVWDPYLDWAEAQMGVRLVARSGVMHVPQDAAALATLRAATQALGDFEMAAFHDLVSMSGSLILGFCATQPDADSDAIWEASRLDELWQEEQWGPDDEATALAEVKRAAFVHAKRFFDASLSA